MLLMVYWALNLPALGQEIAMLAQQYPSQLKRFAARSGWAIYSAGCPPVCCKWSAKPAGSFLTASAAGCLWRAHCCSARIS
jgi:hypothetical protein